MTRCWPWTHQWWPIARYSNAYRLECQRCPAQRTRVLSVEWPLDVVQREYLPVEQRGPS